MPGYIGIWWGWCHHIWKTDKSQWGFRGRERKEDWKSLEDQSLRAWQTRWDYLLPVWKRLRCDSFLGYVRKISLDVVFKRGCVISLKEAIAFERMGSRLWMTRYTCFYIKGELIQGSQAFWGQMKARTTRQEARVGAMDGGVACFCGSGGHWQCGLDVSVSLAIYGSGCTKKVSSCFGRLKDLPLLIQKRTDAEKYRIICRT